MKQLKPIRDENDRKKDKERLDTQQNNKIKLLKKMKKILKGTKMLKILSQTTFVL
jgi:hypothetical protein